MNGRRTKKGQHLTTLAAAGLIRVADLPPDDAVKPGEPEAFRLAWELTGEGQAAAERGWYQCEWDGDAGAYVVTPGAEYPDDPPSC